MLTAQSLQSMPKIELHRHLEGSIRPETIFELSKNSAFYQTKYNLPELIMKMKINGKEKTLLDFIMKLGTRFMLEYTRSKEDIARFAFEACEDAAKDNIIYLEIRCCPSNSYKTPITEEEFLEGVYLGCKRAEKKYGIKTEIIVSLKREDPLNLNLQIAELTLDLYRKGKVVGIDLAGNEPVYPNRRYKGLFTYLKKNEIPVTIHSGETNGKIGIQNVIDAIELLNAKRIGHGASAAKSKNLMEIISKNDILIEVCPTSNIHTKTIDSLANHPVYKFMKNNINISINTDDPITSNITLSSEYQNLVKYHNFNEETFRITNLNAIVFSFLTLNQKIMLKNRYLLEFEIWKKRNIFNENTNKVNENIPFGQMLLPKFSF